VRHILALKPDICSLDLGSLNFGSGALINIPKHIEAIAAGIREAGVKPELEIFDTGHMALALDMIRRGIVPADSLFQFVLGVPWGAPAVGPKCSAPSRACCRRVRLVLLRHRPARVPDGGAVHVMGGHVRVGLEDNLYLSRGVLAPDNASLVAKARQIVECWARRSPPGGSPRNPGPDQAGGGACMSRRCASPACSSAPARTWRPTCGQSLAWRAKQ
jgi:uncharacterized protein (DUF849 family)